jgi:hypothetical protein
MPGSRKPRKPRNKTGITSAVPPSPELERYRSVAKEFEQVYRVMLAVSDRQGGIQADGRGTRASSIFTRQAGLGVSLRRLLPHQADSKPGEPGGWDIVAIASLSRSLMEGYLALYYYGLESVSEPEADLRFQLLQLHRNIEWYETRKMTNSDDPGLTEFETGLPSMKTRVKDHHFMTSLKPHQRKRVQQFNEMYWTKGDFEAALPLCKGLKVAHRLLSNFVHPLPLSIERMDNERGRGFASRFDVTWITLALDLAVRYLAASVVGFADHFPLQIAEPLERDLAPIRALFAEIVDETATPRFQLVMRPTTT